MEAVKLEYTPKDFKSDQQVRWCPGCGDYAIINSLHKVMAEMGIPPHEIAVVSGIGCSSRLPYYVSSYGFHTIHGRGAAVATGVKVANPALTVWQVTGDGDCLAIGGNHFIHSVRRNIDINVLLFNNQIYGLTKGQFSPTSLKGQVSKSSPYGTIEEPFRPAELTFGAFGGAIGGFTTGKKEIIDLLRQRSRPYLFSNSIPPMVAAAGIRMFEMMDETNDLQDKLHANTEYFVAKMKAAGFDIKPTESAICAVMLYDAKLSQEVANRLLEEGIYVIGFYYPVVPKGEARIRVQISAAHEKTHLNTCIDAFTKVGKELGVIG